jgi:hypothetical protein
MLQAKTYLFAYGSLMIPDSVSRALGRPVSLDEMKPAHLLGFRRAWQARVPVRSHALKREISGLFLDLRPAPGRYVNGLILPVGRNDLTGLRLREAQYIELDVTDRMCRPPAGRVITFVADAKHRRDRPGFETRVPQSYVDRIEKVCRAVSDQFQQEFWQTTAAIKTATFDGSYTFTEPEQAKRV